MRILINHERNQSGTGVCLIGKNLPSGIPCSQPAYLCPYTSLLQVALQKAGKNESLATILDLSPSGLSRRINGETGWDEKDINKLLEFTGHEFLSIEEYSKKIETLKDAMKILLNGDK